jgi:hypothetical protein
VSTTLTRLSMTGFNALPVLDLAAPDITRHPAAQSHA